MKFSQGLAAFVCSRKCDEIDESVRVCCTQDGACAMAAKHKRLWSFCCVSAYI